MTLQTLYDEAMLRGARSVPAIGRLGGGTVSAVTDNQPYRAVGNTAVVYQLRQPSGKVVGLRCWLTDDVPPELLERYRALGAPQTLSRLHAADHSPIVNSLSLHADGVSIIADDLRSRTLPLVALDWLMGPTVLAAVDRASKAGDQPYLAALANAWRQAVIAADTVGFVHGNLSPDNAIVRPKEGIAYVDYDTAYWPGAPTVPVLDAAPAYQHPKGLPADPERADDFAALVLFVSLRVLSVWPELRVEHGQPATVKGAALLFQSRDLASPDGSALFGKLRVLNDPGVQGLVGILREACLSEPDSVPPFAHALELASSVSRTRPGPEPSMSRTNKVTSLFSNAASAVRETAVRSTDKLRPRPDEGPDEQTWPEPQRSWRPERLEPLVAALRSGDLDRAETVWRDVQHEVGATALLPALGMLRNRQQPASGWSVRDDMEASARSRASLRREQIQRRFANALDLDDREAIADLALSGDLDEIDELNDASTRRIVATLAAAHFSRAIATDDDVLIIDAYDEGLLGDDGILTVEQRNRLDLAFDRRTWITEMRSAIRVRNVQRVEGLLRAMPDGADARLTQSERIRIERLQRQRESIQILRDAIDSNVDAEVVRAFQAVERSGAPIPDNLPWTHVSEVIDRYGLIIAIRRAAEQTPRDLTRLSRLLPQLKDANAGQYPDLDGAIDFAALDLEVKQAAQIMRIREALTANNDREIVSAVMPDVYHVIPLLDRTEQARIERAIAAASRALRRSGQRASSSISSSETLSTNASGSAAISSE